MNQAQKGILNYGQLLVFRIEVAVGGRSGLVIMARFFFVALRMLVGSPAVSNYFDPKQRFSAFRRDRDFKRHQTQGP